MNGEKTVNGGEGATGRRAVATALLYFWASNVVIALGIATAYLEYLPAGASPRIWLFGHLGLLSTILLLTMVPAGLAVALVLCLGPGRCFAVLQAVVWMLFHLTLCVDTYVFGLYRYHLDGSAWNLLTTPGSTDSYEFGWRVWLVGFLFFVPLASAFFWLWRFYLRLAARPRRVHAVRRPGWALALAGMLLTPTFIEKAIYAQADLTFDPEVAAVSQVFPMYAPVTFKPLLPPELRAELGSLPEVGLRHDRKPLRYPLATPRFEGGDDPETGGGPNVLVLLVDSWRSDMLDECVTPRLWEFAAGARRFDDHLSGGNATRFGIFSLLYGLHGSYWWRVLEERRSPALVDALLERGYDCRVFSSASMDYPEFRSTAWVRIADRVHDRFPGERAWQRDEMQVDALLSWLDERDSSGSDSPWFCFALLDAPHQPYDYPEGEAAFEPSASDLNYLDMAHSRDPELALRIKNRYRNAVRFADGVAGRLLDGLRERGELDQTLVIVSGDHGEEFAENGHWGHTSNFTPEQARVPFLLAGPGIPPGVETRPTSHLDVPRTLLGLLGARDDPEHRWSIGEHLLAPPAERARVVCGWQELGVWTGGAIVRVPFSRLRSMNMGAVDYRWAWLPEQLSFLQGQRGTLQAIKRECARFHRLRPKSSTL